MRAPTTRFASTAHVMALGASAGGVAWVSGRRGEPWQLLAAASRRGRPRALARADDAFEALAVGGDRAVLVTSSAGGPRTTRARELPLGAGAGAHVEPAADIPLPGIELVAIDGPHTYLSTADAIWRRAGAAAPVRIADAAPGAIPVALVAGGGRVAWLEMPRPASAVPAAHIPLRLAAPAALVALDPDGRRVVLDDQIDADDTDLAVDATSVYARHGRDLVARTLDGGDHAAVLLARRPDRAYRLLRAPDALYWFASADGGAWSRIEKLPLDRRPGAEPVTLVRDPHMLATAALDDTSIYWASGRGTEIRRAAR